MALYNVESPGGYMNIGLSIPGADILGYKRSFNEQKPWLFEDFDQITFYEVSEDEYNKLLARFHTGHYVYEYEDTIFDMKEHNQLLRDTAEEVKQVKAKQRQAQSEMEKLEKELLEKWNKEKNAGKVSTNTIEELLNGEEKEYTLEQSADSLQIQAYFQSKRRSMPTCGNSRSKKGIRSRMDRWSLSWKQ